MKRLLILGGGTAGTMIANRMKRQLDGSWQITVVDPTPVHLYQPGLLFLPFGARDEDRMIRPRAQTLRRGVRWLHRSVQGIEVERRLVWLGPRESEPYDLLVIASGAEIRPSETEGLAEDHWHRTIFDFYTLPGAQKLREALARFDGGRLVVNVVEMPIKCPVAPLEFLFLADAYFSQRGIRDRVELVFATPLEGAFTRPVASSVLGDLLREKAIEVVGEFSTGEVDGDAGVLRSYDEREVPFDLLVSVPLHGGAPFIEASGLGDELGFVPTETHTLRAKGHDDIFALGDATDLPASKAGSVAHFQAEVLERNLLRAVAGKPLLDSFDGHANCFVESGFGKALLIDFNYDVEPLPGRFPLPGVGPFSLLKQSRINHVGKRAFRWLYWNRLLSGKSMFVSTRMTMRGKRQPRQVRPAA